MYVNNDYWKEETRSCEARFVDEYGEYACSITNDFCLPERCPKVRGFWYGEDL